MRKDFSFEIEKEPSNTKARAGKLSTPHGVIETPAFVAVATKATVKALTKEELEEIGTEAVIANTYHLFLQPGDEVVRGAGGLHTFMQWDKPIMTDSGGFQIFSLGDAWERHVSKLADSPEAERATEDLAVYDKGVAQQHGRLAIIDEEGVSFTSHLDGSLHRFTPERSIEIQHKLGADIMFAFDECTSPTADYSYQKEALNRTHRWAKRSLSAHRENLDAQNRQALFGIVQGGRYEELRRESAHTIAGMEFDGFGIGGSYIKEDLDTAVGWVCEELPKEKPRHLLGIGEPEDLLSGILKGVDLFDCVLPTRLARTGVIYTQYGKVNLLNEKYIRDFSRPDNECLCRVCSKYTKAYLAHLFRGREILGSVLASYHNLFFLTRLVKRAREALVEGNLDVLREEFLSKYNKKS